jgi:hypothetical protein
MTFKHITRFGNSGRLAVSQKGTFLRRLAMSGHVKRWVAAQGSGSLKKAAS